MIILKNQHEPFVIGNSVNYHGVLDTLTMAAERASHHVIMIADHCHKDRSFLSTFRQLKLNFVRTDYLFNQSNCADFRNVKLFYLYLVIILIQDSLSMAC